MPRLARAALLGAAISALGALLAFAQDRPVAFRGATLIDGTDRPPVPNATVVIHRGWILAAGPPDSVTIPAGARVVKLAGRFLLPGMIDMHAHLAIAGWVIDSSGGRRTMRFPYDETAAREVSRNQLAYGITTVRNPAGPTEESVSLRNRIRTGELEGPRIFTAGWPLDRVALGDGGVAVATEEQVRAEVRRQAAAGVDYIKLYAGLEAPLVRAGIDEAHRLGIKAIAHLWRTSWTDAALADIDGIVHISPGAADLLPEARRAEYTRGIRGTQFMFDWFKYVDFDGPDIAAMMTAIVKHRVAIDPTVVAFEAIAHANDSSYLPEAGRLEPPSLANTMSGIKLLTLGWTPADFRSAQDQLPRMLELVRRLHRAGVLLTIGTDAANPWYYGRELELFVAAGIPPADVLRMATRNGAMSLGVISELGTVERGKRADLVILSADPLADIGNTRRVESVVVGGALRPAAEYLPRRLH